MPIDSVDMEAHIAFNDDSVTFTYRNNNLLF